MKTLILFAISLISLPAFASNPCSIALKSFNENAHWERKQIRRAFKKRFQVEGDQSNASFGVMVNVSDEIHFRTRYDGPFPRQESYSIKSYQALVYENGRNHPATTINEGLSLETLVDTLAKKLGCIN
jgi:hypothetical protein